MKLWVTPNGDRWLCAECEREVKETIEKEAWRAAFDKLDPMLRCANCGHSDVDVFD